MNSKKMPIMAGAILLLAVLVTLLVLFVQRTPGEDPEPLPASSSRGAENTELEPEEDLDAQAEAGVDATPAPGKHGTRTSKLVACCRVVAQNAASAPTPLARGAMLQAASVCESAARSGQFASAEAILREHKVPCD